MSYYSIGETDYDPDNQFPIVYRDGMPVYMDLGQNVEGEAKSLAKKFLVISAIGAFIGYYAIKKLF